MMMSVREETHEYDFDNLHIEIDNSVSELKLNPFQALDVWHLGIEQWNKNRVGAHNH